MNAELKSTDAFDDSHLRENYERLIHSLSIGKGLQAIVDIGSELLENPIAIADSSFKILAATSSSSKLLKRLPDNNLFSSAVWSSVSTGQPNKTSVKFVKSSKRYEQCIQNPAPHIVERAFMEKHGLQAPCSFIDCSIRIKGMHVAILSVSDTNRPFRDSDLDYCSHLADMVSLELQKNELFIKNYGVAYESLLTDLLENQVNDSLQVRLRLQNLDKTLKENLYVVTVRRMDSASGEAAIPLVGQSAIRAFFPGSISVNYKNDIVLLLSRDAAQPVGADTNEDFWELLNISQMKAGVSEMFHDPIRTQKYYRQSVKAIELGSRIYPKRSMYSYYQVSVFHALELAAKSIKLRDLAHPLINRLNDSKNEGDKELLKTLYVWLFSNKDTEKILHQLHIGRSTLFYRLNKIRDMLGDDMDSGEVMFQLMLSFKLVEYYSGFVNPSASYWFKPLSD